MKTSNTTITEEPTTTNTDNNASNIAEIIATTSYDDLYSITPRELERNLQRASSDYLARASASGDINEIKYYEGIIAQWSNLKVMIEERTKARLNKERMANTK